MDPAPLCVPYIAVLLAVTEPVVAELPPVLLGQAPTASWRLTRSSWSSCWTWRSAAAWSLCGAFSLGLLCLSCTPRVCKHTNNKSLQLNWESILKFSHRVPPKWKNQFGRSQFHSSYAGRGLFFKGTHWLLCAFSSVGSAFWPVCSSMKLNFPPSKLKQPQRQDCLNVCSKMEKKLKCGQGQEKHI